MQEEVKENKLFGTPNKYLMLAIVLLLWGALYLPKLGLMEVQGTESRRMMPASEMYHGGSLMMPELAGKQYIAKPPLIYWLEAASYSVFGETSYAARLPSTLLMLVFAVVLIMMPCNWLNLFGRFIGAVIFLTASGCVIAGRSADIDGGYMVSVGLSILVWLNLFTGNKSKLCIWGISGIILGIGMLFKGPLILLFFYLAVISFSFYNKSIKELFCWQHLLGIVLMLILFLPWTAYVASIYHSGAKTGGESAASGYWLSQMLDRFNPVNVEYGKWLSRVLGAVVDFAPWFLLLPFLWVKKWTDNIQGDKRFIFKALRLALLLGFLIVNIPGTRSRYSLPLYPLAAILIGWILFVNTKENILFKCWKKLLLIIFAVISFVSFILFIFAPTGLFLTILEHFFKGKLELITEVYIYEPTYIASAAVLFATLGAAIVIFKMKSKYNNSMHMVLMTSIAIVLICANVFVMVFPFLDIVFDKKQLGSAVSAVVPKDKKLYIYKQGYEPYYYYFKLPMKFVYTDDKLPEVSNDSQYYFLDSDKLSSLKKLFRGKYKYIRVLSEKKYKRDTFLVVEVTNIP